MYMHKDFVVNAIVRSLRLWSTEKVFQRPWLFIKPA